MGGKDAGNRDFDQEVENLFSSIRQVSTLVNSMATKTEHKAMESKKAVFSIKGIHKKYILEVIDGLLQEVDSTDNVTTYCYASSAEKFLEYFDRIFAGDPGAFEKAVQRGDFVMKGEQSFHDRIMWKKALDRLATARKEYNAAGL